MDDLREAMEAAFDEAEQAEETETTEGEPQQAEEAAATEETPEVEAPEKEPESEESGASTTGKQPVTIDPPEKAEPTITESSTKPPASWSAKARESWGKLPADAQAEVMKREGEVNKVLQDSATARRAVQELNQVLGPHAQRLMASGAPSPMQAISTLLTTEGQLRSGDTQTKAQTVASLIKQYGVDIESLDAILSNEPMPQRVNGTDPNLEALLDQKLAPYQQFMSDQQAQAQFAQERSRQEANQSVEAFSAQAEFINDVRMDMADLMDMAASRGQNMSLQEAYDKACALNAGVSQVLSERQKQSALLGQTQTTQNKKAAAVSITGDKGGSGGSPQASSLRAQLDQAWGDSLG